MAEKYIDKRLLKFAKSSGKFIKLEEGDSFKGTFLTWRFEHDEKFKKEKPVFVFKDENGSEKTLGTSAKKFVKKMSQVIPGSLVQVTRLGEGQKTDYSVKVLKEAKMPANVEDEEDEEEEEEVVSKESKKKPADEEDDEEEDEEEEEEDGTEDLFGK